MSSGNLVNSERFRILVLALVAVAVMLPVLIFGIPQGHDMAHHYQCAMTFVESIRGGDFYPSWSLNRNFGFGGMETRLYPPLSHYSLALAYLATGSWFLASWLVFTFFSFIGAFGAYRWARETLTPENALFAGCLYAVMPYHLNQLYNTFFYAEFVGASLIPFTFLFISRVCRGGGLASATGLAISFALLILTHLPLSVIGALCFTLYALSLLERARIAEQLSMLAVGVGGGLAMSSFFWLKVVLEKNLMARTAVYPEPMFDYRLNFLLTAIQSYDGVGLSVYENSTIFYDKMLFLPLIVVLAAAVPFIVAARRIEPKHRGVWLVLIASTFLTLPFSSFLWRLLAPLQEIQFPWRFVTVVSLTASVVAASNIDDVAGWFKTKKRPFALIVGGAVLALVAYSAAQVIRPATYLERPAVADFMAKTATGAGLEFWWPIDARKGFEDNRTPVDVPGRDVTPLATTATSRVFRVSEGAAAQDARVAVFYHPNWTLFVDDAPAVSGPRPANDGALLIALPKEAAKIEIRFVERPVLTIARAISVLAWLIFVAAWVGGRFVNRRRKSVETLR